MGRWTSTSERSQNGIKKSPALSPPVRATMKRDVVASMATATTEAEYHTPVYSSSLGVAPSQIKEAQKRFPHHEFAPDGRMILRSHAQRKRVLKELGFFDKDSFS